MPLISIGFDNATKGILRELISALNGDGNQHDELKSLILNLEEKLMAEAQDFKGKIDRLTTEVAENKAFVQTLKDQIANLQQMIEAGASDRELAAAVREVVPQIDAAITELDTNTPAPPPDETPVEG